MLFSNDDVAATMKNFEAAWECVRDVPKVHIDFGDGHTLDRTLNGNVATFLCTADGRVFDVIPGLYDAPTYLARLGEGLNLFRAATRSGRFDDAVTAYHKSRLAGEPSLEEVRERSMMKKSVVEDPLKRAILARIEKYAEERPTQKIAFFTPIGLSKSRVENRVKEKLDVPVEDAATKRETIVLDTGHLSTVGESDIKDADSRYNEVERTPKARRLIAEGLPKLEDIFKAVYRDVLGTDLDDPYLGLAPMVPGGELGRDIKENP